MHRFRTGLAVGGGLLVAAVGSAWAQGANSFDGTYIGVSASNLGGMLGGGRTGCVTFRAPSPLTIVNGHVQGSWGPGATFDGEVAADGAVRMKSHPFEGIFQGRIADRKLAGRYQGACNYDLTWQKRY